MSELDPDKMREFIVNLYRAFSTYSTDKGIPPNVLIVITMERLAKITPEEVMQFVIVNEVQCTNMNKIINGIAAFDDQTPDDMRGMVESYGTFAHFMFLLLSDIAILNHASLPENIRIPAIRALTDARALCGVLRPNGVMFVPKVSMRDFMALIMAGPDSCQRARLLTELAKLMRADGRDIAEPTSPTVPTGAAPAQNPSESN